MRQFLRTIALSASLLLAAASAVAAESAAEAADRVYRDGVIFTAGAGTALAEALAIRDGKIIYVGSNQGLAPFTGPTTAVVNLKGRFLMPGLVDGHMHPLAAGAALLKCDLNYEALTLADFQRRIQLCIDQSRVKEPDAWLEVVNWFQESMRPAGVKTSRATLDVLTTSRPIIVQSSFGHTVLANSRALSLARITASTVDPIGGKIWRDPAGQPTGLLEDAAFQVFRSLVPRPTAEQDLQAALAALAAMNRQGVTSFLDAAAAPTGLAAFATIRKTG